MTLPFWKMEGAANDFVVVYADDLPAGFGPERAAAMCDRRRGIGADGVLVVGTPTAEHGGSMEVWNADGSIPEMCGNGLRCVVRRLVEDGHGTDRPVQTGAGLVPVGLVGDEVRVELSAPGLLEPALAITTDRPLRGASISMGNPHYVVWADEQDLPDLLDWAPAAEVHPAFPHRTNVEFATQTGPARFDVRVWERGVGETQACGSGACAVAVAARWTGRTDANAVEVVLPGGLLRVEWTGRPEDRVTLQGPARTVFVGTWRHR